MRSDIMWDRWDEVDEIFARALERPYEQRHEFIVQASGDDAALLETLTALVAASERAETDFAGPADALLREVFGNAPAGGVVPERTPGELLGRYRLIRELGRGGMATVFEAERADGLYEQRVAIKLLRHGIEGNELAQRLQLETRILSNLAHPGIAQLLDAGTTEDKQPFFVMELVEGEPITSWADRQRLDIDSRLDLFVQVADAVGFAHKRLVVHRDIKPSNVLVANDGRVKLLDFGIAKLLEPESVGAAEADQTTRWMTPVYAAPEQFLGRPVTTATDVYGLGGLLYELLAGKRPFEDRTGSDYSLASAVCESVPDAPSAVVAGSPGSAASRGTQPERLRRLLAGDLDAIVSKALRKEPEDRYPSAEALAEDVRRHRTGFPVAARAGLRSYRLRKFLERHWWSVGAAAAIILTLAVSSLVLWRQQIQTAEARDNAAQAAAVATMEAENARLVIDFLADVFRGRDPMQAPSDTLTARERLAWGSERVDQEFSDRPYGVLTGLGPIRTIVRRSRPVVVGTLTLDSMDRCLPTCSG
jgi:serine/threonine-protein kinase